MLSEGQEGRILMRELLGFLIQAISVGIGDLVDSSFGNSLSTDAIVVLGSYTVISWFGYVFAKAGGYIYRAWQNRFWTCMLVSLIISGIMGVGVVIFRNNISHLFSLTELQYSLLNKVFAIYGCYLIAVAFGSVLDIYALVKGKVKELMFCNTIYYILLILIDLLVVLSNLSCEYLILGTGISWVIFDILLAIKTKVFSVEKDKITLRDIWTCCINSIKISVGKMSTRVAILFVRSTVSELGTIPYALFTVANSVEDSCEFAITGWNDFLIVRMGRENINKALTVGKRLEKKFAWLVMGCVILGMPMSTLLLKGDLPYLDVLFYASLMIPALFEYFWYCKYESYLTLNNAFTKVGTMGFVSAGARVIMCIITHFFLRDNLMCYIACWCVDMTVRLIMVKLFSYRIEKKQRVGNICAAVGD